MTLTPEAPLAEFDSVAADYRQMVEQSIRFSGKDLDFFARAKVDHLVDLGTRLVGDLRQRAVLDVGCGNGATDRLLAPSVGTLDGIDMSASMVAEARQRNPGGRYASYDGATLPFDDETFDLTFAICVMHHVPPEQWDSFAQELLRVTRPTGAVMVFEHNPLNPLTRRAVRNCPFDADAVLLRSARVAKSLQRAGGAVIARRFILFTPLAGPVARKAERLVQWLPAGAQYAVAARPPANCR